MTDTRDRLSQLWWGYFRPESDPIDPRQDIPVLSDDQLKERLALFTILVRTKNGSLSPCRVPTLEDARRTSIFALPRERRRSETRRHWLWGACLCYFNYSRKGLGYPGDFTPTVAEALAQIPDFFDIDSRGAVEVLDQFVMIRDNGFHRTTMFLYETARAFQKEQDHNVYP